MLNREVKVFSSPGQGLGLFKDRAPQTSGAKLPAGTIVVSADSHFPLREDIWFERMPDHLKDRAPRVWFDDEAGLFQFGLKGKPLYPKPFFASIKSIEDRPGPAILPLRMNDLEAEGVQKEIVFPQVWPLFFTWPDLEVRAWMFRIYNQYMAEQQALEPDRFFPVGIPNYWDPAHGPESVREIKALGLKTLMLPISPGTRSDGSTVVYQDPEFESTWAAIESSGLPACFHIGETLKGEGLNGGGARVMLAMGSSDVRKILGQLIFGLTLDKFPKLRIVFAEANINWIPGALNDAEMIYNSHAHLYESKPQHRPTYYWHTNCYATFIMDPAGMRLMDIIGADRVMWSTDYPHNEGSFGYSQDSMQVVVNAGSNEDEVRALLGGTAIEVFGLDKR